MRLTAALLAATFVAGCAPASGDANDGDCVGAKCDAISDGRDDADDYDFQIPAPSDPMVRIDAIGVAWQYRWGGD